MRAPPAADRCGVQHVVDLVEFTRQRLRRLQLRDGQWYRAQHQPVERLHRHQTAQAEHPGSDSANAASVTDTPAITVSAPGTRLTTPIRSPNSCIAANRRSCARVQRATRASPAPLDLMTSTCDSAEALIIATSLCSRTMRIDSVR